MYLYSFLYRHVINLLIYHSQQDPFHPVMILTSSGHLFFSFLEQYLIFLELFSLLKISNVLLHLLTEKEKYQYFINRYILEGKKIKYLNGSILTQLKFIKINMSVIFTSILLKVALINFILLPNSSSCLPLISQWSKDQSLEEGQQV